MLGSLRVGKILHVLCCQHEGHFPAVSMRLITERSRESTNDPLACASVMQLKNLKAVQLLGAGVETVINDSDIPHSVPLLRIADPLMGSRLATWVCHPLVRKRVSCSMCLRSRSSVE